MLNPKPRYRLYGGLGRYISLFKDLVLGKIHKGKEVETFETEICRFCGAKYAICMPQNRVGLYVVLSALLRPGQRVIMTPYTVSDMFNMVLLAGAKPFFCDVDRETCNIDPDAVMQVLDSETDIGAVVITHLHGLTVPIEKIIEKCRAKNILLIEDAAQSFGGQYGGKRTGTIGDVGVFSFGMFKNIATWFGGAVVTDDEQIAGKIRHFLAPNEYQSKKDILLKVKKGAMMDFATAPFFFQTVTFRLFKYGFLRDIAKINKMAMTELDTSKKDSLPDSYLKRYTPAQARIGLKQLPNVDCYSRERIAYAKKYYEGLKEIKQLIMFCSVDDLSHIYTYFPIQYGKRDELLKFLMKNNRDVAAQHYKNCANLSWLQEFHRPCPNADKVAEELIFLPTYHGYGIDQVEKNIRIIQRFFAIEELSRQY